jgi:curved DNA-binding protein CbpA
MRILLLIATLSITQSREIPFLHKQHKSHLLSTTSWYRHKPHDTALYDLLNVRHDASAGEISKSYRKLSLKWHPDKIRRRHRRGKDIQKKEDGVKDSVPPPPPPLPHNHTKTTKHAAKGLEEEARGKLAQITGAYEILSNDQTRLLYHRFGIRDGVDSAVRLLSGRGVDISGINNGVANTFASDEQRSLLLLMGYNYPNNYHHHQTRHARVHYITCTTVEKLRPLVEGTVNQETYIQSLYDEYITLSKSALGKQILRCVGRAYRREGYRVLRTMDKRKRIRGYHHYDSSGNKHHHKFTDLLRDSWRDIKHISSAAVASGKLAVVETKLKRLQKEREMKRLKSRDEVRWITTRSGKGDDTLSSGKDKGVMNLDNIGALPDEIDKEIVDELESMFSDDEYANDLDDSHFEHLATEKTYTALLSAHQTEVLWKLTKMDLDSTVSEACRRLLSPSSSNNKNGQEGWYAFFPSENSPYPSDWNHNPHSTYQYGQHREMQDGWVGTDGHVIPMEVGRLRAAAALVLVGDMMVRCGKDTV